MSDSGLPKNNRPLVKKLKKIPDILADTTCTEWATLYGQIKDLDEKTRNKRVSERFGHLASEKFQFNTRYLKSAMMWMETAYNALVNGTDTIPFLCMSPTQQLEALEMFFNALNTHHNGKYTLSSMKKYMTSVDKIYGDRRYWALPTEFHLVFQPIVGMPGYEELIGVKSTLERSVKWVDMAANMYRSERTMFAKSSANAYLYSVDATSDDYLRDVRETGTPAGHAEAAEAFANALKQKGYGRDYAVFFVAYCYGYYLVKSYGGRLLANKRYAEKKARNKAAQAKTEGGAAAGHETDEEWDEESGDEADEDLDAAGETSEPGAEYVQRSGKRRLDSPAPATKRKMSAGRKPKNTEHVGNTIRAVNQCHHYVTQLLGASALAADSALPSFQSLAGGVDGQSKGKGKGKGKGKEPSLQVYGSITDWQEAFDDEGQLIILRPCSRYINDPRIRWSFIGEEKHLARLLRNWILELSTYDIGEVGQDDGPAASGDDNGPAAPGDDEKTAVSNDDDGPAAYNETGPVAMTGDHGVAVSSGRQGGDEEGESGADSVAEDLWNLCENAAGCQQEGCDYSAEKIKETHIRPNMMYPSPRALAQGTSKPAAGTIISNSREVQALAVDWVCPFHAARELFFLDVCATPPKVYLDSANLAAKEHISLTLGLKHHFTASCGVPNCRCKGLPGLGIVCDPLSTRLGLCEGGAGRRARLATAVGKEAKLAKASSKPFVKARLFTTPPAEALCSDCRLVNVDVLPGYYEGSGALLIYGWANRDGEAICRLCFKSRHKGCIISQGPSQGNYMANVLLDGGSGEEVVKKYMEFLQKDTTQLFSDADLTAHRAEYMAILRDPRAVFHEKLRQPAQCAKVRAGLNVAVMQRRKMSQLELDQVLRKLMHPETSTDEAAEMGVGLEDGMGEDNEEDEGMDESS